MTRPSKLPAFSAKIGIIDSDSLVEGFDFYVQLRVSAPGVLLYCRPGAKNAYFDPGLHFFGTPGAVDSRFFFFYCGFFIIFVVRINSINR